MLYYPCLLTRLKSKNSPTLMSRKGRGALNPASHLIIQMITRLRYNGNAALPIAGCPGPIAMPSKYPSRPHTTSHQPYLPLSKVTIRLPTCKHTTMTAKHYNVESLTDPFLWQQPTAVLHQASEPNGTANTSSVPGSCPTRFSKCPKRQQNQDIY